MEREQPRKTLNWEREQDGTLAARLKSRSTGKAAHARIRRTVSGRFRLTILKVAVMFDSEQEAIEACQDMEFLIAVSQAVEYSRTREANARKYESHLERTGMPVETEWIERTAWELEAMKDHFTPRDWDEAREQAKRLRRAAQRILEAMEHIPEWTQASEFKLHRKRPGINGGRK